MKRSFFMLLAALFLCVFLYPEAVINPVQGAQSKDWNHQTFWHNPWGKSGVHKGIDVFAKKGTPLLSSTAGVVLYSGHFGIGGQVVAVLGPKWKVHYYAHLGSSKTYAGARLKSGQIIGTVGDSGNAKGKPAHVHYSILSLVPRFWRWDDSPQGWKKIFYLNPSTILLGNTR